MRLINNPEGIEFLEKFREQALDNPDFFKIDYKNIKRYIENPWPEEAEDDLMGEQQEDDYQSSEDLDSIPSEIRDK